MASKGRVVGGEGGGEVTPPADRRRAFIATPLGPILVVTNAGRPEILCFASAEVMASERLRAREGVDLDAIPEGPMPRVAQALDAYFLVGEDRLLRSLGGAQAGTSFQQAVWALAQGIPRGRTCTYGELAGRLGKPSAARAVGQALAANLLHLIVPCHRVLPGGGGTGSFNGGAGVKEALLERERKLRPA